jgi:hypothetical protein
MTKQPDVYLELALRALERVPRFLAGRTMEAYLADELCQSAVERQLEVAGDARGQLRRLDPDLIARIPEKCRWMPRRRAWLALGALGLAGLVSGTAWAGKGNDPFRTPRAQVVATVKTIGVMPLEVTDVVPDGAAVANRYEADVVRRLEQAGFAVVPPAAMREVRERVMAASGPLYSPIDGTADNEKIKAFNAQVRTAYVAAHPVDALLSIAIVERDAGNIYNQADWDGVSENSTGKSGLAGFFAGGSVSGTTPALSFVATLRDRADQVLYQNYGGLQVLRYVYVGQFKTTQRAVDPHSLLSDPHRDARAIALALDPLTGTSSPEATAKVEKVPEPPAQSAPPSGPTTLDAFIKQYPRLLLVPVGVPEMPQQAAVVDRLDNAMQRKLTALGFQVEMAPDYRSTWHAELERVGGFYDPQTGKLNIEKIKASRRAVFARVVAGRSVQAVVYPALVVHEAAYAQGEAQWDGVKENVFKAKTALGSVFNMSRVLVGQLQGLSLEVRIADADDVTVFKGAGGLRLLVKYQHGGLYEVPVADWMIDETKDQVAIDLALQGLAPVAQGK